MRWPQSLELGRVSDITESLRYSKVYACWIARLLTNEHRTERVNCCNELLDTNERDKTFFQRLISDGETWIHHYEPESKDYHGNGVI